MSIKDKFFGFFKSKESYKIPELETEDASNNPGTKGGNIKPVTKKVYALFKKLIQPRNYELETPDDDFDVIQNAFNVESLLRRARDRYCELIWENSYKLVGKNKKAVQYVKTRLKQIARVTDTPTDVLLEELAEQLVLFYNVFILKIRNKNASGGTQRTTFYGKRLNPVAGYFVLTTQYMKAVKDKKTGKLKGYVRQKLGERPNFYKKEDIIHISLNRKPDSIFGTPAVVNVLDDIRALRRIEENVEILIFQNAIPLVQYKVGTEDLPAQTGEVEAVQGQIEAMVSNGLLVTPYRHDIKAVGENRSALRIDLYLEYFKNRIFMGLGQSATSMGEGGASKGAATSLNKSVFGSARRFQRRIQLYFNDFIMAELLEEGGFDTFDEKNLVEMYIPEIDLDDKIRKEFHTLALFEGNIINEDEARNDLGRDPFNDKEREKTYWHLVTLPRTILISGGEPGSSTVKKGTQQKEAPKNQYGVKKETGPPKNDGDVIEIKDSEVKIDNSVQDFLLLRASYLSVFKKNFDFVLDDIFESFRDVDKCFFQTSLDTSKNMIVDKIGKMIVAAYSMGIGDAHIAPVIADQDLRGLHALHISSLNRFFDDISSRIAEAENDVAKIITIFEALRYRINGIADYHLTNAFETGKYRINGII